MSYSNAGLRCLVPRIGSGPALWTYTSTDSHTDVDGTGYFSDGANFGIKTGDLFIVVDSDRPGVTLHVASSATTIAAAVFT
jgi:hypothetical protein